MKQKEIAKITNLIISKSSAIFDLGLLSGRTGVIIFLYHYSQYLQDKLYADFAGLLLDDLFEDIHNRMDISFDKGLSGICWGIEYILKNNFVEGDPYDILEDVDKQIMSWDIKRIEDESLESGLEGIFHYILYHLSSASFIQNYPFDDIYLKDLDFVVKEKDGKCQNKDLQTLLSLYMDWRRGIKIEYSAEKLMLRILSLKIDEDDKAIPDNISIGIDRGYAGIGFQIMDIFNLKKI